MQTALVKAMEAKDAEFKVVGSHTQLNPLLYGWAA
jgi:hypothetical protein